MADLDIQKNKDHNQLLVSKLNFRLEKIYQGGGTKKIEKQHENGEIIMGKIIELF